MSECKFEAAIEALGKPQDSKTLLNILSTIRKEVEWPKNKENISKLRDTGCLKYLVRILQMPQKYICDIDLSILGNCLMDRGCARDAVGNYNILSPLNQLIKRYPKEDSVNNRLFRIIGNLCHHKDQWANIITDSKPRMVTHLVEFIKTVSKDDIPSGEIYSEGTVIMAIRALRLFLNCRTAIPLIKSFGVLKAIGGLFIKLSIQWQEQKKNENIIQNILKLLYDYSRFKYYHSILEMRNTERGDALLYLSNVLLLSPKRIVKIIMNLIRICQLKSELPIPEICDKFIDEVLRKNGNAEEFDGDSMEYIQCLCYLLQNPANRTAERCGKCLLLLIKVLDKIEEPNNVQQELCTLIVTTLNNCSYDDNLILEQVKCNVLQVLLRKLQWIVGSSTKLNVEHKIVKKRRDQLLLRKLEWVVGKSEPVNLHGKKRKCHAHNSPRTNVFNNHYNLLSPQSPTPSEETFRQRQYSPSSSDDETRLITNLYDRTPSPSSSIDNEIPFSWTSPQSTPEREIRSWWFDSDSDDYSPVCSEADSTEFPMEDNDMNEADAENSSMLELEDDEMMELPTIKDHSSTNSKIRLVTEIALLLKSYTKVQPPLPQLGSEELLVALLKCSGHLNPIISSCVNEIDIICKILDSPEYLLPLMKTAFIETLYDLTKVQHNKCSKCLDHSYLGQTILKKFTMMAESEMGKGDVAHVLLRGSNDVKEKLALVIPYVFKNKNILAKLMLNCGGLNILLQFLREDTNLKGRSIKVLSTLASEVLQIANPTQVTMAYSGKKKILMEKYKISEDCTNIVTFKLDDGTSLDADREFLSKKSDFFSSLLNGHFKEKNEDEICLHNVKLKSLRCLLHLLKFTDNTKEIYLKIDLETLLDVIVLSDRYLLAELCGTLTNCVERFRMSSKNVPVIYKWSLESSTNLLRVEAIAFALVAKIVDAERLVMFNNLFNSGYLDIVIEDIRKLLVRYLTSTARA